MTYSNEFIKMNLINLLNEWKLTLPGLLELKFIKIHDQNKMEKVFELLEM